MIYGVFGHPGRFWQRGNRLGDLDINAVFVSSGDIDQQTIERARAEGCQIFAEFATLNGLYGDYVANHPEAHPIDETGQPAARATWFMGACPTDPGFRAYRMGELRTFLSDHDVDGVWMDYLHWHAQFEDSYPQLCKTCFNETRWPRMSTCSPPCPITAARACHSNMSGIMSSISPPATM